MSGNSPAWLESVHGRLHWRLSRFFFDFGTRARFSCRPVGDTKKITFPSLVYSSDYCTARVKFEFLLAPIQFSGLCFSTAILFKFYCFLSVAMLQLILVCIIPFLYSFHVYIFSYLFSDQTYCSFLEQLLITISTSN